MSAWLGYYAAQITAIITFGAIVAWGLYKNWEGVVIVFGFALLVVGCTAVRPT